LVPGAVFGVPPSLVTTTGGVVSSRLNESSASIRSPMR
jgi:hypothetical protein